MKNKVWPQILLIVGVVFAWVALQRWILPAMGVKT
jgi:hypothetical protein